MSRNATAQRHREPLFQDTYRQHEKREPDLSKKDVKKWEMEVSTYLIDLERCFKESPIRGRRIALWSGPRPLTPVFNFIFWYSDFMYFN